MAVGRYRWVDWGNGTGACVDSENGDAYVFDGQECVDTVSGQQVCVVLNTSNGGTDAASAIAAYEASL